MKKLLPILALLIPIFSFAQSNISGKIVDSKTGAPIDITSIYTKSNGTISNELGEFELRTDNDTLYISHLSYRPRKVAVTGEFLNIGLEPKDIILDAAVIRPYALLQGVYEKYLKIYKSYQKQDKKLPKATFYYRQTTTQDSLSTEFIECFFYATPTTRLGDLAIKQGRYAKVTDTTKLLLTFTNAYFFSQISPITLYRPKKKRVLTPLCRDWLSFFDVKLESLVDANTLDEIRVYRFARKKKKTTKFENIIEGCLHIRTRDSTIVKFEGEQEVVALTLSRGLELVSKKNNFVITYKDSEPFPIVESVKADMQIGFNVVRKGLREKFNETYNVKINTIMYATEYNVKTEDGRKKRLKGNLLKNLKDHEYDPSFWQDNPIIKRTPIENKIIEDFNKREYFGNFKL